MSTYYVGSDHCYSESQNHINVIVQALQKAGHKATSVGVGPNKESVCRQHGGENDTFLVFTCCGVDGCTEWSIKEAVKSGAGCKTIFAYTGFAQKNKSDSLIKDADTCDNHKLKPSKDSKQFCTGATRQKAIADIAGRTHKQYHEDNSEYIAYAYSDVSIEDLAQKIVDGNFFGGAGSSGGSDASGSVVRIPDKTFYGTIKQICGATDSLFITANNMAYLLTFKDFYYYREEFMDLLPTIEAEEVVENSIEQEWDTQGFYNVVEIKYKDGTLKYAHDALVAQYGEKKYHYDFPDDSYDTAKTKAAILLSEHIRDYSMDIKLSCLYDENITAGSYIKVKKTLINSKKFEEYSNSTDYDAFYVQAFTVNWTPKTGLSMDLYIKYVPMTPEDPINATLGAAAASVELVSGEEIAQDIKDKVAEIIGNETDLLERAKLINQWLQDNVDLADYDCMHKSSPSECLAALPKLNCADTAQLTWAMMTAAGIKADVAHAPGHFWTVITINGEDYASDGTTSGGLNKVIGKWQKHWESRSYKKCGSKPSC